MRFLDVVHSYEKKIDALKLEIEQKPCEWPIYQSEVDHIIRSVFELCLEFERRNRKDEEKLYKMKRLFIRQFRPYFRLGRYNRWVMDKPFGYAGDFWMIDEIYRNSPSSIGVERCLDNYFLQTEASVATRNRKENFKDYLVQEIKKRQHTQVYILDLAAGPCRDIAELFFKAGDLASSVFIDCLDHDSRAIDYARQLVKGLPAENRIRFIQRNAVRLAVARNIEACLPAHYDVIFSTGLFDYLNEKIVILLIRNLKKCLKQDGLLIISNYRDKWSNPSRHYMEWGGDWKLVYRTEKEFLDLFIKAGFSKDSLSLRFEPQRIMQYCFAQN